MRYDTNTMLPEDAFKKDPLGRIRLHGGGGGSSQKYDPTKDKQYKEQKAFLETLKGDIAKNNQRMTPEQIIAALSPTQQSVIGSQMAEQQPISTTWGNFNLPQLQPIQQPIVPQQMQQPTGQFGYSPDQIAMLQKMLANSSLLPSVTNTNTKIGG